MSAHSSKRNPRYVSLVDGEGNIIGTSQNPLDVSSTSVGTAQPPHVLAPHTFENADGVQTGTMADYTGMSPVQVTWQGGVPTEVRVQVPATGFYNSQNPIYPFFAFDPNFLAENIRQGVSIFGLNGSYTGTTAFAPSKYTLQTNATSFYADSGDYVLLFNSSLAPVHPNLYGVVVKFMDSADVSWEYESGKTYNLTDMTFSTFKNGDDLIGNVQKVGMGTTTLDINFGSASISGNTISFDMVFTPSGGTFTINTATPMMSVDVWSYP